MKAIQKLALSTSTVVGAAQVAAGTVMAQTNIEPPAGFADDLGTLINAAVSFVMIIAALLVFMYLIWGGIEWITSGGDKGKTESARNKITAAVLGLIVLAASYAILMLALRFLGFTSLNDVFNQAQNIEGAQMGI
jgi:uncharacterized membrane protein YjgN (DUF898 family)